MKKWKAAEYEAETLWIQQQVAKAKACAKILEELNEEGKYIICSILHYNFFSILYQFDALLWHLLPILILCSVSINFTMFY